MALGISSLVSAELRLNAWGETRLPSENGISGASKIDVNEFVPRRP
jgi:hypothetical protein